MKISVIKTQIFVLSFFVYFFLVNRIGYLSSANTVSLTIGVIVIIWLLIRKVMVKVKKYSLLNFILLIFCIAAMMSGLINAFNIDGTFLYLLKIISIFLFVEYASEINKKKVAIIGMMLSSFVIEMITLYYILFKPLTAWYNDMNYLNGTKFSVSYNILTGLLLFVYIFDLKKNIKNKILFGCLAATGIYICVRVFCTTGVLACIGVIVYAYSFGLIEMKRRNKKYNIFYKAGFAPSFMVMGTIIVIFLIELIVNINFLQNFIVNVLGKSATLTGRTIIYSRVGEYFKGHFIFGHGYNSVYSFFKDTMLINGHYSYDAQNALLEHGLYFGIIGIILLLTIIYVSFMRMRKESLQSLENKKFFIFGYYVYAVIGIVEITINPTFYLYLALIASKENNDVDSLS